MNQNAPIDDRTQARARPAPPALSPDARALLRVLMEGDTALARRKDLGELLRRLQAAQPSDPAGGPAFPQDRLDRLEDSLNRIDGALRIELAPILKTAVQEGLASHRPAAPRARGVWLVLLFIAGCAVGSVLGPSLQKNGLPLLHAPWTGISGILPQNWGRSEAGNQID
jgi:hypothetical protein